MIPRTKRLKPVRVLNDVPAIFRGFDPGPSRDVMTMTLISLDGKTVGVFPIRNFEILKPGEPEGRN